MLLQQGGQLAQGDVFVNGGVIIAFQLLVFCQQLPVGGIFLLQGGDGPAQQIPPHRIGEEGEAVKVDVQIEEEVGPGGVLDPADQF